MAENRAAKEDLDAQELANLLRASWLRETSLAGNRQPDARRIRQDLKS